MARKNLTQKIKPISKVGWYYPGGRRGLFCPECGEPLLRRNGIHPRLFCLCGWEEPPIPLENLLGKTLAQKVRARQLAGGAA